MKYRLKNMLRDIAKHVGLKVVFVDYFEAHTHGKLLVRERRILLNAHTPRTERIFTLLHEVGHFVVHYLNAHRQRHPRIFDLQWKMEWFLKLSSSLRRYFRYLFSLGKTKEWEADLWAFCAFIYLARQIGCHRELLEFIMRHLEKSSTFALAALGVAYRQTKDRCKGAAKALLLPFRACMPHR